MAFFRRARLTFRSFLAQSTTLWAARGWIPEVTKRDSSPAREMGASALAMVRSFGAADVPLLLPPPSRRLFFLSAATLCHLHRLSTRQPPEINGGVTWHQGEPGTPPAHPAGASSKFRTFSFRGACNLIRADICFFHSRTTTTVATSSSYVSSSSLLSPSSQLTSNVFSTTFAPPSITLTSSPPVSALPPRSPPRFFARQAPSRPRLRQPAWALLSSGFRSSALPHCVQLEV